MSKVCVRCGSPFVPRRSDARYCSKRCRAQAGSERYRAAHGKHRSSTWSDPDYHRKWRGANREKWNAYGRSYNERVRRQVFEHYGTSCACCGESTPEFLTIDHVNGDGAAHRASFSGPIYRLLIREGFPDGYQTLCWNCNAAKSIKGGCPHQR